MPALPAQLRKLPAVLRQHLVSACDGDFTRLRFEQDGSVTVLNHAVDAQPAKPKITRPAGRTPAKRKQVDTSTFTRTEVPARAPAKRTVIERTPTLPAPLPPVRRQPQQTVQMPKHLSDPPLRVERRAGEERRSDDKPVLRDQRQRERRRVLDRPLPPAFDIRAAWEDLDATQSAMAMLEACRSGLPEVLPLDMHAEVLALEGIQFDLVVSCVRNPSYVEVAGKDTTEKGYPILRFSRGDMMVVVGLREAQFPVVIAVYVTSRLDADEHRSGTMKGAGGKTGGGGARKQAGLPGTPKALMNRLGAYGVEFNYSELTDTTASATFRGQELGKVKLVGVTRSQCESDYQRLLRKVEAIQRRAS